MKNKNDVKKLLIMATLAGKIMLKNGAETYRVEDTVIRICKSRKNIQYVQAFVTPTGIIISLEYENDIITYVQRIKSIKIDLNKIAMVNDFSRKFVSTKITVEKGMELLNKIDHAKSYSKCVSLIFGSFGGAFFSLLFGGSFFDFICAFLVSLAVIQTTSWISKLNITFFLNNFIGSIIATILSILFTEIGLGVNMDKIIIGSIMSLVPGVAITNAIRDSISGEFLSGLSRGMETLVIALSVAFGVGITLKLYFSILGG